MSKNFLALVLFLIALALVSCAGTSSSPNPQQDIEKLRAQAEQGDVSAQRKLGMMYDAGQGVHRDLGEAAKWYGKAAQQGDSIAQNNLGSLYLNGEGVEKNYEKALAWYKKSAEADNPQAQNSLGYMYDLGLGVKQDVAEAKRYYERSAEQGWTEAMLNLGILYGQGKGEPANKVEAYKWLDLARFYSQNTPSSNPVKWRSRGALDELKPKMTKEEIEQGITRAQSWEAAHRKP